MAEGHDHSVLLYRHYFIAPGARDDAFLALSCSAKAGDLGVLRAEPSSIGTSPSLNLLRDGAVVTIVKVDSEEGALASQPFLEFRVPELTPANVALAFDCLVVTNLNPVGMVWLSGYGVEDFAPYSSKTLEEIPSGLSGVLLTSEDFMEFVG